MDEFVDKMKKWHINFFKIQKKSWESYQNFEKLTVNNNENKNIDYQN